MDTLWCHLFKEWCGNGDCVQRKRMPRKLQRKVCNSNFMNSVAEAYVLHARPSIPGQCHDLRHGRWVLLRSASQPQKNLLQRSLDKGMWTGHNDIPSITHSEVFKYCKKLIFFSYTVTPCWFSVLNTAVCPCPSQIPWLSLPPSFSLVTITLLQRIEQSSLCWTAGPCWFSVLNTALCPHPSQTLWLSLPATRTEVLWSSMSCKHLPHPVVLKHRM